MNVIFTNPGEIDARLITTLGVNVKEGPSPIGFFGTGLKYAIAVCLRHNCSVEIQSGLTRHFFCTRPDTIRGKEFQFIFMGTEMANGEVHWERLGFTTDLGKTWELWMAYREFYCNAKDEGGNVRLGDAEPISGQTTIIVSSNEFLRAHHARSSWLLSHTPEWKLPSLEIIRENGSAIFYKGIKVCDLKQKKSLFTYNILSHLQLTEDRTIDAWSAISSIRHALCQEYTEEHDMLRAILTAREGVIEHDFEWVYNYPDDSFVAAVEKLWVERNVYLNKSALTACRSRFKTGDQLESVKLTVVQQRMLDKARNFLEAFGYPITQTIIVVETLGDHWLLGQAKDGEIFLARSVFDKGTKYLCSTLLEEYLHITHGFKDCSRELQDWLFDKVISLGEEAQGEPL